MPSDALAAPHMPPIREIRPRGGTQKSVEGRWTHHVRCFFVPLTHRPDVCGWFGRRVALGLRHQGGPLVSARRALATLGTIEGYAVGGCCDLSTSTHHLVQRLGVEQGYNLAKESGRDLEEGIACATAGLRRRFAARVWRDYYKHVDARRRYANPTDEGLVAQQRDRQIEEESRRRENEERVAQYNYFAARASNRSAWARAGMG